MDSQSITQLVNSIGIPAIIGFTAYLWYHTKRNKEKIEGLQKEHEKLDYKFQQTNNSLIKMNENISQLLKKMDDVETDIKELIKQK
jgi:Tfp pilus assembly protein PilO